MTNISEIIPRLKYAEAGASSFLSVPDMATKHGLPASLLGHALREFVVGQAGQSAGSDVGQVLSGIARQSNGQLLFAEGWLGTAVDAWNANNGSKLDYKPAAQPQASEDDKKNKKGDDKGKGKGKGKDKGDKKQATPKLENIVPERAERGAEDSDRSTLYAKHGLNWLQSEAVGSSIVGVLGKEPASDYVYKAGKVIYFTRQGELLAVFIRQVLDEPKKEGGVKNSLLQHLPKMNRTDLDAIFTQAQTALQDIRDREKA
mgnify:CR=1 FL=1